MRLAVLFQSRWPLVVLASGLACLAAPMQAQRTYQDSVRAVPCIELTERAAQRAPTESELWSAFSCAGDRDTLAVVLWQHALLQPRLLDIFRSTVPASERTIAMMFRAARGDSSLQRRLSALNVLIRFVNPHVIVVARNSEQGLASAPASSHSYDFVGLSHAPPPVVQWRAVALQHIERLAFDAEEHELRAISRRAHRQLVDSIPRRPG